jgi:carbamoyltransferase
VAGLKYDDIDITAIGFDGPPDFSATSEVFIKFIRDDKRQKDYFSLYAAISNLYHDFHLNTYGERAYFDHHLSHVASSVIPSRFLETNFISLDGWGGNSCGLIGWWRSPGDFFIAREIKKSESWGMLYQYVTEAIGFRPHSGEGKTMGLASYGKFDKQLLPDWCDDEFGLPEVERYRLFISEKFPKGSMQLGATVRDKNLAATLQYYYERSLLKIAEYLYKKSGIKNFSLAGGVALNCTGNGVIASAPFVNQLFVQPASHDAGTALGAAILAYRKFSGSWPNIEFMHAYWGPSYSDEEIESSLIFSGCCYQKIVPEIAVAEELSQNRIVGLFQGRAEIGPRALGNRSIIAHPGFKENLERINLRVKRREVWRPLAPSVLSEHYDSIFEAKIISKFMLISAEVRDIWKSRIPAVVHVDGSARPQAVESDTNPLYHRIISEFYKSTGLPVVLNTSFNLDDEPLVNSPEHAIATFYRSGIDSLVIGSFMVKKNYQR